MCFSHIHISQIYSYASYIMWLYYFCFIAATMGLPTLMFMSQKAEAAAAIKARKEGIANGTIDPNPNVQLAKEKAQREQMKIDGRNAKAAAFQPGEGRVWSHTPSNLTLLWLAISVPLVIWDTGYVLLRPHSMPGGKYHWPLWVPYELYGRTDYVYGWKAWNEHNGFTAAQGCLNVIETLGYLFYMYIVYTNGRQSTKQGRGAPTDTGVLSESRTLKGQAAGLAVLVGYSASIMTVSKTVLYCKFRALYSSLCILLCNIQFFPY